MIEMTIGLEAARKVLHILADDHNGDHDADHRPTDSDVGPFYDELKHWVGVVDARAVENDGPWRKVVGRKIDAEHSYDVLECGHQHMLETTTDPQTGSSFQEDHADKWRCAKCRYV